MTEAEWLAGNDAEPMFAFLAGRGDARRWRLFSCACLREVGHLLADCDARTAFAILQRWADGRASDDESALAHARTISSRRYLLSSRFPRNKVDRRIFARMMELSERGAAIDIITLTEELGRKKEVEAVGGVAYISSLIDGVPHQPSIEQYVKIVKDKSLLRNLIHASNNAIVKAMVQSDTAAEIIDSAESAMPTRSFRG